MKVLLVWLEKFQTWLNSLFVATYKLKVVDGNLPSKLRKKILYVVQEDGYQEHASMLCPCGCGETLHMNLIPDDRPLWKLIQHQNGTIGLQPSVWRKKGCQSHFWLINGRVHWCPSKHD